MRGHQTGIEPNVRSVEVIYVVATG